MSPREREVVELLVEHGCSTKVGEILGISRKTVSTYLERIREALYIDNNILLALSYERWKRQNDTSGTPG